MRSEGNCLFFEGDLRGDPLPALAAMHDIVKKQGYHDITLDFSQAQSLWPSYMVPLTTICCSHRFNHVDFEIILPDDQKVSRLIVNSNWAHIIQPKRFDPQVKRNSNLFPAKNFLSADDHFRVVDDNLSLIVEKIPGIDRKRLKALEWALNEITDNVLNHAYSCVGGGDAGIYPSDARKNRVSCL